MALLLVESKKKWAPKEGSWILDPDTLDGWFFTLLDRIRFFYFEPNLSPKWPIWDK